MKGDKKILVVAVLLLLLAVSFSTYAIYRNESTGTGTVNAAAWSVKVKNEPISNTWTFSYSDIHWTTLTGYADTIAPGSTGTITIPVDATGSEVDVIITAALGSATLPDGMTVSLATGSGEQTIGYNATSMTANVVLNIAWSGADSDTSAKDTTDKAAQDTTISIPVTLTAKQSVVGH